MIVIILKSCHSDWVEIWIGLMEVNQLILEIELLHLITKYIFKKKLIMMISDHNILKK